MRGYISGRMIHSSGEVRISSWREINAESLQLVAIVRYRLLLHSNACFLFIGLCVVCNSQIKKTVFNIPFIEHRSDFVSLRPAVGQGGIFRVNKFSFLVHFPNINEGVPFYRIVLEKYWLHVLSYSKKKRKHFFNMTDTFTYL